MKDYFLAIQNHVNLKGRATRREYWFFFLYNFIFLVLSIIPDSIIGTSFFGAGFGYFSLIHYLWLLIPAFTISARRMYDTGSSARYLLMGLMPLVGRILITVKLLTESQFGTNQYVENPKQNLFNYRFNTLNYKF